MKNVVLWWWQFIRIFFRDWSITLVKFKFGELAQIVNMELIFHRRTTESITWNSRFKAYVQSIRRVQGLNVFFATLCIIDLFGVFPLVALPGALISCGNYTFFVIFFKFEYFLKLNWTFNCIPGYYGIPLLIFVLTIQIYTAVVLGRCWIIAEKLDPRIIDKKR